MSAKTIQLGEIIDEAEVKSLRAAVRSRASGSTVHSAVMAWVNARAYILERWRKLELLPAYAAYLLEYYLELR